MNNEYVAVQHVYALGKSWPVSCMTDNYEYVYYVTLGNTRFVAETMEELQEIIDKGLER